MRKRPNHKQAPLLRLALLLLPLLQVAEEDADSPEQRPQQQRSRRRASWIPRWLCGSSRARSTASPSSTATENPRPRAVLCSIDSAPGTAAGGGGRAQTQTRAPQHRESSRRRARRLAAGGSTADAGGTSVAIGGVEELVEFVRSSVLAGPRPFSFAFHEQSLR